MKIFRPIIASATLILAACAIDPPVNFKNPTPSAQSCVRVADIGECCKTENSVILEMYTGSIPNVDQAEPFFEACEKAFSVS